MRYQCFKKDSDMGKDIYRRDTTKQILKQYGDILPNIKVSSAISSTILVFENCVLVDELHDDEVYRILQRRAIFS